MKKDFVISDLIALEGKDFYYDIHNCYSVKAIEAENDNTQLRIIFEKDHGNWVKDSDPQIVELHFDNVTFFETSLGFFENPPKDVGEMAYKNKGDFDYSNFLEEKQSTEQDDFILRFIDDEAYVRVFADKIQIVTR